MNHHWTISPAHRAAIAAVLALNCTWPALGAHAQTSPGASAKADATAPHARIRTRDIGQATQAWLEMQRTNAAAAPALPMPGAQATLAYQRYMDSFTNRIPASFGSTLSGNGGASSLGYMNGGSGAAQPAGAN